MGNEDISGVFEKINNMASQNNISPDMLNNLVNMFNKSSNSESKNASQNSSNSYKAQDSSFNDDGFDFETIMKMKTIIDKINAKDDPRANLLQSLKPYLNENRKSKIDQYIQLMNMSKVMDVFPFMGGDKKK